MEVRESTLERVEEDTIVQAALKILAHRLAKPQAYISNADDVKNYLVAKLSGEKREVFAVMYLNAANAVISFEIPFAGTLRATAVYPREIIRRALEVGASAVVFSHNHPSGNPTPSTADEHLTDKLRSALAMVDVRVLDHIIVAGIRTLSFAEKGLIQGPRSDSSLGCVGWANASPNRVWWLDLVREG